MDFSFNRRTPLFVALVLGLSLGTVACNQDEGATQTQASGEQQGKVVATVNGKPITEGELKEYRSARPNSAKMANQEALIDELVTREVVYQDAVNKGLDKDPEVLKELEQLRTRVLVSAAVRKAMEDQPISDKELQAEYDKLKDRMVSTEYKASHILVKDEAKAKELISKLDAGGDFATLARNNSTGPTGKKGGDLGWFNPKQMVPPFSKALAQLEKGSYTKEPVKTQFGWHVIKLADSRQSEAPSFEEVKGRLENMAKQKQVGQYIEKLKNEADISIEGKEDASKEQKADAAGAAKSAPAKKSDDAAMKKAVEPAADTSKEEAASTPAKADSSAEAEAEASTEAAADTSAKAEADTSSEAAADTSAEAEADTSSEAAADTSGDAKADAATEEKADPSAKK